MRWSIAAVLLVTAGAAQAATYVVDIVADPVTTLAQDGAFKFFATPLAVDVGDTIDFNVSFTGGAAIRPLRNPDQISVGLLSGDGFQNEITTNTIQLIGASGFTTDHAGPTVQNDCCQNFFARFYPTYPRPFGKTSFTGLTAVVTLTGQSPGFFGDPVLAPRHYSGALFYIGSSVVPEPASWALLTLGFVGVGVVSRRRAAVA